MPPRYMTGLGGCSAGPSLRRLAVTVSAVTLWGVGVAATASETVARPPDSVAEPEEKAVDLDALDDEDEVAAGPAQEHGHPGAHGAALSGSKLKVFFDLILEHQFGVAGTERSTEFKRDHAHVMLELSPSDNLHFRTDIAYEPAFYEASWRLRSDLELRAGKILIPFGQNEFHHLIGGRVDRWSMFLPVIWSDYGVAVKHNAYDGAAVGVDYIAYVVNGFASNDAEEGEEPLNVQGKPSDNNAFKGMGLRPMLRLGSSVTLAASCYYDRWDDEQREMLLVYGLDVDLGYGLFDVPVLRAMRLRAEIAWAELQLPELSVYQGLFPYAKRRSGYNVELSSRVRPWLQLRYREGLLNADSTVVDANDVLVHEPAIIATAGAVHLAVVLELHTYPKKGPLPAPRDGSKVYARLFFRY